MNPNGDDVASQGYKWSYYLLGGSREQVNLWEGLQTSDGTFCDLPVSGGSYVHLYPSEYLVYGVEYPGVKEDIPRLRLFPDDTQEYRITDHLASVRATLDGTGTITHTYDYKPFGSLFQGGPEARQSFNSREKDQEAGLFNNGVRKLEDDDGRFTSIDPLWEKFPAWSPYQYGYNNPLTVTDPGGMQGSSLVIGNVSASGTTGHQSLIEQAILLLLNKTTLGKEAVTTVGNSGVVVDVSFQEYEEEDADWMRTHGPIHGAVDMIFNNKNESTPLDWAKKGPFSMDNFQRYQYSYYENVVLEQAAIGLNMKFLDPKNSLNKQNNHEKRVKLLAQTLAHEFAHVADPVKNASEFLRKALRDFLGSVYYPDRETEAAPIQAGSQTEIELGN